MNDHITIKAASPFRAWLGGQPQARLPLRGPTTVGALLRRMAAEFATFPELPVDDRGLLQSELLIYSEGRFLRAEDAVAPGMTLELLPSTAGG